MARNEISIGNQNFVFGRDKQSIAAAYVFTNFCRAAEHKYRAENEALRAHREKQLGEVREILAKDIAKYQKAMSTLHSLGKALREKADALGFEVTEVFDINNRHNRDRVQILVKDSPGWRTYQHDTKYMGLIIELYEKLMLSEFTDLKAVLETFTARLNAL